jgi:hypothetical protein
MQMTNITADGQPFGERETLPMGLTKPETEGTTYSEAHCTYSGTDFMLNPSPNPHAKIMRRQLTFMLEVFVHNVCNFNLKTLNISTNTDGQALSLFRQMDA